ncbi:MAG: flagellar brake domain-containing protein [Bacillota bacterium]|nr:flagellar brake domain-containing protein [Bacillota bacterium]
MANIGLNVNSKCEVIWEDSVYKSNVQDINEEHIGISIPVNNGEYATLKKGDNVEVYYYDERTVYKFETEVIGRKIEGVAIVLLAHPTSVKKIQRRRFVRVSVLQKMSYVKIKKGLSEKDIEKVSRAKEVFKEATVLDLSGSGMRMRTLEQMANGDVLLVKLPVKDDEVILVCNVVRAIKDSDKQYNCGLDFEKLDEGTREKIISYVFEIMRIQMKRGLKGD